MEPENRMDIILRPVTRTTKTFYIVAALLLGVLAWSTYAWFVQLREGLAVTGLGDIGVGPPWGLYITNFIFFVGVAHGGIAISAAVRIAGLKTYKPITRIAELLTPISLLMAAQSILFDLGRPDRIFNLVKYYTERMGQSPLAWDWTVIIIYFTFSVLYLYLLLRKDVATCLVNLPRRWGWFYRLLLIGYKPDENVKIEKLAWWMALCIPALLVLLSGGVIAWLLGLMIGRPGWYGAFMGPYFVTAAIASAIAAVIIVAVILRHVFGWKELMVPDIFRGLANFLAASMFVYLYMMFAEQLTMQYPGPTPTPELSVSQAILTGEFSWIFWSMFTILLAPTLVLFLQAVFKKYNITVIALSSVAILIGLWVKRFLIVVPSLTRSLLPYPVGTYTPTWVEWSLVAGTFAAASLMYLIAIKIIPVMELEVE